MPTNIEIRNVNPVIDILSDILMIITAISVWKIFSDNNISGWKSLIPFYNEYLFGKIAGEEKKGMKLAILEGIASVFCIITVIIAVVIMAASGMYFEQSPEHGLVETINPEADSALIGVFMLLLLITLGLCIGIIVLGLKIKSSFTKKKNAPDWWMAVWFFAPWAAYLYFAFLHEKVDIPGITEKKI